jgi:SAM-dependent methyltransferase
MQLSGKELKAMNNPIKELLEKYYIFRIHKKLIKKSGLDLDGKAILDAGCGSGYNLELISREWHPKEVCAFDFMPEQVELARQRGLPANIFVGDITDIDLPSERFDIIFINGVLHHVPRWRVGLREINRVLKPGGLLLIREPNKKFLDLVERFFGFSHPEDSRFDWPELIDGLNDAGFAVIEEKKLNIYAGMWRSYACKKAGNEVS